MMDIKELIERLNDWNEKYISNLCGDRTIKCEEYCIKDDCMIVKAATALSTLKDENEKLQTERDALLAANQRLLAEREQLTAERDAAVSDVSDILAEVEEIRRGYGVDNADADAAFADLCGNYCAKCSNNCYEEAGDYRCKNYEWRGIQNE